MPINPSQETPNSVDITHSGSPQPAKQPLLHRLSSSGLAQRMLRIVRRESHKTAMEALAFDRTGQIQGVENVASTFEVTPQRLLDRPVIHVGKQDIYLDELLQKAGDPTKGIVRSYPTKDKGSNDVPHKVKRIMK